MRAPGQAVTDIEIVEDLSATARCDEGFLRVRRLRCRNRRADGTFSPVYRVDVVDRPRLDAVAVLVYRRGEAGLEVLTRKSLRPAALFRRGQDMAVPDEASHLRVEEIVAGLLEPADKGEAGLRHRAAEEVREEAGYEVRPEEVRLLGGAFFVAPGIISEKIFPAAVEVTGKEGRVPEGDGTPLEEGTELRWRSAAELLAACQRGEVPDAKTEICLTRLLVALGSE